MTLLSIIGIGSLVVGGVTALYGLWLLDRCINQVGKFGKVCQEISDKLKD